MTFVHGYLLGGLLLVTVPILVHLIMRQKPKHVRFPAFRFLRQKFDVTQNRLRIQHWLLLLLRILIILLLCLALSRPRLFSSRIPRLQDDQPVAIVMLFDTSMSMEYQHAGAEGPASRLETARARALELLDELPPNSKIAVLDSAEIGGDFVINPAVARERIQGLQLRPDNAPLTRQLGQAYSLLARLEQEVEPGSELPPRFLYLFSDRTFRSWDNGEARALKNRPREGIHAVFVDAGLDKVADLAIDRVDIEPLQVPPGGTTLVRVTVRATGTKAEGELQCQFDNDANFERRLVRLGSGESQIVSFERRAARPGQPGLSEGYHQVTVRLRPDDALPYNNLRHATFVVRAGRSVLTVVDQADSGVELFWRVALEVRGYRCDVVPVKEFEKLTPDDLKKYHVIALFQLSDPPASVWERLLPFVQEGGGLALIPAGNEMSKGAYNDRESAKKLLPGVWEGVVTAPKDPGLAWNWTGPGTRNAFLEPFNRWRRTSDVEFQRPEGEPVTNRFWQVTPVQGQGEALLTYGDDRGYPVLLERRVGRGKVMQFTSPLDSREEVLRTGEGKRRWHNYWENSFGLVLADRACRHLAGDSEMEQLNHVCGQLVIVPLGAQTPGPFKLFGPQLKGVVLAETDREPGTNRARELPIARAVAPGNYLVLDGKDAPLAAFSMSVNREESLLERVPVTDIEDLLGENTVVSADQPLGLKDVLQSQTQPLELLPLFMLLLLLALAIENLLGNINRAFQKPGDTRAPVATGGGGRSFVMLTAWTVGGALLGALLGWGQVLGYPGTAVGALVTGLLGLVHALLLVSRMPLRGSVVLGGLLGSMVGVLYGGALVLRLPSWEGPPLVVVSALLVGAVMAADGWITALLRARRTPQEVPA